MRGGVGLARSCFSQAVSASAVLGHQEKVWFYLVTQPWDPWWSYTACTSLLLSYLGSNVAVACVKLYLVWHACVCASCSTWPCGRGCGSGLCGHLVCGCVVAVWPWLCVTAAVWAFALSGRSLFLPRFEKDVLDHVAL
ncbi:hypothetical protein TNCT_381571 [Trichonephila clavata]|uniref:Uncharacterized protein n=1 Tax=Trichonephila clavata TaxID=2740835 RepID=A0A8X6FCE0_TRICU|nr:hypothetical protein TNCT_381571 [Trichonephila clavata]